MSIESMAMVLHHSRAKGTTKLVLLGIANHAGDGGAYPTVETLARYGNCDERTVQRAIDKLVSTGELQVQLQQGGDRDCPEHLRPNRYAVMVSCPPWCDHTSQHRDTRKLAGRQLSLLHRVLGGGGGDASVTPPVAPVSPHRVAPVSPKPSIPTTPPTPPPPMDPDEVARLQRAALARAQTGGSP
jgi:Helix-turn-helix domain